MGLGGSRSWGAGGPQVQWFGGGQLWAPGCWGVGPGALGGGVPGPGVSGGGPGPWEGSPLLGGGVPHALGGPLSWPPPTLPPPPGSDSFPERRPPRKGNTLYVYGAELSPELLRGAFGPFGAIIDLSMDAPRKWAGPGRGLGPGGGWEGLGAGLRARGGAGAGERGEGLRTRGVGELGGGRGLHIWGRGYCEWVERGAEVGRAWVWGRCAEGGGALRGGAWGVGGVRVCGGESGVGGAKGEVGGVMGGRGHGQG